MLSRYTLLLLLLFASTKSFAINKFTITCKNSNGLTAVIVVTPSSKSDDDEAPGVADVTVTKQKKTLLRKEKIAVVYGSDNPKSTYVQDKKEKLNVGVSSEPAMQDDPVFIKDDSGKSAFETTLKNCDVNWGL